MRSKKINQLIDCISILDKKIQNNSAVKGITYDSRRVGENFIFIALEGIHTDGHLFIDKAIEKGASTIIYSKRIEYYKEKINYIRVEDTKLVMAKISSIYYDHPSEKLIIIGVTGTDGKSTTVWFVHQLLESMGYRSGFWSTVEYLVDDSIKKNPLRQSTPESVEVQEILSKMVDSGKDIAVMEATSHGLSKRTLRLFDVLFDAGVFTNITHEHLEFHGTFDNYKFDKANLFRELNAFTKPVHSKLNTDNGIGIINLDDPNSDYFIKETKGKVYTYSINNIKADMFAANITPDINGTNFNLYYMDKVYSIYLPITGVFNVENFMAASLVVCKLFKSGFDKILSFIPKLKGVAGRMIQVNCGQPFKVIIDYAHTPGAFQKIMNIIRPLVKGKLIAVFGSAGERDVQKRPILGEIASNFCDIIILTDEDPRMEDSMKILKEIAAGCKNHVLNKNLFLIPDRDKAIYEAFNLANVDDNVILLGKGHETSIIYSNCAKSWNEYEKSLNNLKKMGYSNNN